MSRRANAAHTSGSVQNPSDAAVMSATARSVSTGDAPSAPFQACIDVADRLGQYARTTNGRSTATDEVTASPPQPNAFSGLNAGMEALPNPVEPAECGRG